MAHRICQHCGKPMQDGMTDLLGFYTHEGECFEAEMDKLYGNGRWYSVENDGEDGYYMVKPKNGDEPFGTGIFYTNWYDEEEEEDEYGSLECEAV